MDPSRLFQPNPFAGDRGEMSPDMRAAMDEPDAGASLRAIAAAITQGRLLVPALPHEHPGRTEDGGVAEHHEKDPTGDAIAQAATLSVRIPGGRFATPVFSCLERLQACYPDARPIPVLGPNAAAQALVFNGIFALDPRDPSGQGCIALGRGAVAAIATKDTWDAPWDNPRVLDGFYEALAEEKLSARLEIEPLRNGILRLLVIIGEEASEAEAFKIVQTIVEAAEANPYLRAHLDVVEVTPFQETASHVADAGML